MTETETKSGPRGAPVTLPAPDCDLLTGVRQIAMWLGISIGQARERIADGIVPTFKVKGGTGVYALKSEINARAYDLLQKASLPAPKSS